MVGMTFDDVATTSDTMTFSIGGRARFEFYHSQDCCESVNIEDICGDLMDLVGSPLLVAAEVSGEAPALGDGYHDSYTWTFYKFSTVKGHVTVRWLGESNGYYSENVQLRDYLEVAEGAAYGDVSYKW